MSSFDFNTELNVNILGHIFEQSLTDLEELQENKTSKCKKEGIFYTPEYITDYICRNTIIPYLSKKNFTTPEDLVKEYSENIEELEEKFRKIKILDPACGSGAFLLKAVDVLLEIHKEIQTFKEFKGQYSISMRGKKHKQIAEQFTLTKWNEEYEARKIIENNIFGVDINEESTEITKLSLFLKIATGNRKLIDLSQNIKVGNSLISNKSIDANAIDWKNEFSEIFADDGFDIIIGNPPYGRYGTLGEKQKEFLKQQNLLGKTSDISESFIRLGLQELVKDNGLFSFIIPKGLSYVKSWEDTRKLLLKQNIRKLIDASKAFEEVLYEQIIFILKKQKQENKSIEIGSIRPNKTESLRLSLNYFNERVFPTGLDLPKIQILEKITKNTEPIKKFMKCWYGKGGMTPKVNRKNKGLRLLTGKEIARYGFNDNTEIWFLDEKYVSEEDLKRAKIEKVVAQDIVAHITKPTPYIKLTASLDTEQRFCLNTVMCFAENKSGLKNPFLLSLINSKLISFYYYFFIFNQAIRTMHFMPGYSDYIPIPTNYSKYHDTIIKHSKTMLDLTNEINSLRSRFLLRLKTNYSIHKFSEKIASFHKMNFDELVKELGKRKVSLSLKQQDELEDYFDENKLKMNSLQEKLEKTNKEINQIFYDMYGLDKNDINVIEENVPI